MRLELYRCTPVLDYAHIFQFHKGAIRTIKAHFGVTPSDKFQFHKGAIRTIYTKQDAVYYPYFNSIKVRLEHANGCEPTHKNVFQFHKGAIRTMEGNDRQDPVRHFNSIKVRLEQTESAKK